MVKNWLFICCLMAIVGSCNKQEIKQHLQVYDYGYFPLDSGMWRQYDVTAIEIDNATNFFDTLNLELREVYGGWFLNANNDSVMRIDRFVRSNRSQSWQAAGVWQAFLTDRNVFQIEENVKFLKIKFPLAVDADWNGDAYNRLDTLEEYRYTIRSFHTPETVNALSFDSVLTVIQKNKVTLIDKVYFFEKYAFGLGLIERQQIDVRDDSIPDPGIPIENRIKKGTMYYQKITDYGHY